MRTTCAIAAACLLARCAAGSCDITAERPGGLFAEGEGVAFAGTSLVENVAWTLADWRGDAVRSGCVTFAGRLELAGVPTGYYRLTIAGQSRTFAVVRREPCRNTASPIAVDSAFTGCSPRGAYDCPWYDGDTYRVTAELMGRCGLVHTRERTFWPQMNPKPDVYTFDRYLENARLLRRNGIVTEGMIHSAPKWAGGTAANRLPTDLVALYRLMERAVPAFAPYYDSWEFWNEPELGSTVEPVWEYAAAYKAFALGCRVAPSETVILTGSLSDIDRDGYAKSLFDNGIAKYADALNIHTYEPPAALPKWHRRIREYLDYGKVPHWQIWLTEAGTNLEGYGGRDSIRKGLKAHTPEQELVMAEFAPKFQILQRFGGIFRTWSFLFGCYNECNGEKDWGMMRRDGSVKPIVAALATAAGELGDSEMLGEKKIGEGMRAFVYRRSDGKGVMAFWCVSAVDTAANGPVSSRPDVIREVDLPLPVGECRITDVMGTTRKVASANGSVRLAVSRYPQYLSGFSDLRVDVPASPVGEVRRYEPCEDEDLTVVVRPILDAKDFTVTGRKSRAELGGESGKMRLEIWNLSDRPKLGKIGIRGGMLRNLPEQIELPPFGKAECDVVYEPPPGDEIDFALRIGGKFDGRRISESRVTIKHRARFLGQMTAVAVSSADRPDAWKRNDNADRYGVSRDDAENAVRFEVRWNEGKGRWFYPVYTLTGGDTLRDAAAIEFEVRTSQDKVENDFGGAFLMVVRPDAGERHWLPYASPTSAWERRIVWLPPETSDAVALRFGCNPLGHRLTYSIRNIRILKFSSNR